jgi:hypothetical protein
VSAIQRLFANYGGYRHSGAVDVPMNRTRRRHGEVFLIVTEGLSNIGGTLYHSQRTLL